MGWLAQGWNGSEHMTGLTLIHHRVNGSSWPKAPVQSRRNFLQILKFRRSGINLLTAGGFYRAESIICSALQTTIDPLLPVAIKRGHKLGADLQGIRIKVWNRLTKNLQIGGRTQLILIPFVFGPGHVIVTRLQNFSEQRE
jgi:hypothetical protein